MAIINVCCNVWAVGGFEIGFKRLSVKLPQYNWRFTTNVIKEADLIIYANDDRFYDQAKQLNKPTIQRMTGPRSYGMSQPDDLSAVICSSLAGFNISKHPKKQLIYNGVDFDYLKTIKPIACDLLYSPARQGVGQRIDIAAEYARKNHRKLTVLGSRQHLIENTAKDLRRKYPEVIWTGLVDPDIASAYMKGCIDYIMPTPVAGVSNAIIEAVACGKNVINLGNAEIPPKDQIDIKVAAKKYDELIQSILKTA
jgi:hypothetical protein